jgi:FtsP/CotA-like multicopper oxidase with cupredoxin domain
MRLSRRAILELAGAAIGSAALQFTPRAVIAETIQPPMGLPGDLPNPPVLESVAGVLTVVLDIAYGNVVLPQGPASLRLYNGTLPGACWRVRPGDRIEVELRNRLPPDPEDFVSTGAAPAGHDEHGNRPNRFNTTNLHFHGMHVDPRGNGDNVFLEIHPGQDFRYSVDIPADHPPGTFWYHPHRHGSVAIQIASGMAGMIVVDDPSGRPDMVERQMIIQSPIVGDDGTLEDPALFMALENERNFLINGVSTPLIHIREGETQLWRLLSANDSQFLPLDFKAIAGIEAKLAGWDGIPLTEPRPVDQLMLAPGNRADLVVTGRRQGRHWFSRDAFDQGLVRLPQSSLGQIVVLPPEPAAAPVTPPRYLSVETAQRHQPPPIREEEIARTRVIELGHIRRPGQLPDLNFTINGKPHQADAFDIVCKLGEAEEWTFVNLTPFPHPMHIHVNPFQVIEINGEPLPDRPWMDTVIVPAAGVVKIRTRFEDFPGDFVMHCHILPHEDAGMMMNIRIVE